MFSFVNREIIELKLQYTTRINLQQGFLNFNSYHPRHVKLGVGQNLFRKIDQIESDKNHAKIEEGKTIIYI